MNGMEDGKTYDLKFKCKNCGCTMWHIFGDEPGLVPMCLKCGAFTDFKPGDEKENNVEKQNIWGLIIYVIREVLQNRGNVKYGR